MLGQSERWSHQLLHCAACTAIITWVAKHKLFLCSLISLETHENSTPPELSAREEEALRRTATCLEACRIGEVTAGSLLHDCRSHL